MKWMEGFIELLTVPNVTGLYPITCKIYVNDVVVVVVVLIIGVIFSSIISMSIKDLKWWFINVIANETCPSKHIVYEFTYKNLHFLKVSSSCISFPFPRNPLNVVHVNKFLCSIGKSWYLVFIFSSIAYRSWFKTVL